MCWTKLGGDGCGEGVGRIITAGFTMHLHGASCWSQVVTTSNIKHASGGGKNDHLHEGAGVQGKVG